MRARCCRQIDALFIFVRTGPELTEYVVFSRFMMLLPHLLMLFEPPLLFLPSATAYFSADHHA